MNEHFHVEELEKSFLVYEEEEYLGEVTLFSENIIKRLNELYEENFSFHVILDNYRKRNDFLVLLLSDAVKQGFDVDLDKLFEEWSE